MKINRPFLNKIRRLVDNTFDNLWHNLIGSKTYDPHIPNTLSNLFKDSSTVTQLTHDQGMLNKLLDITKGYIEIEKEKTKNEIIQQIEITSLNSELPKNKSNPAKILEKQIPDILNKSKAKIKLIIENETNKIQNMGVLSDIIALNENIGTDDPIIVFLVNIVPETCDDCKRLHFMPDLVTPRCWYLSELKHDYAKRGDSSPSILGQHPNCEASGRMATIMPGWGFVGGRVTFIKDGYNIIKEQRDL